MARLAPIAVLLGALTLSASAAASGNARVPPGVTTIDIRSAAGVTARVTKPDTVRQIVSWFNALPRFVPRPCPYPVYRPAAVTFKFRGPRNGLTTAVDRLPGTCSGSIEYGNYGQVGYAALADDGFVARVSRLLGVDVDPGQRTAANERAAGKDASSLLRLVSLPPGSRRFRSPSNKKLKSAATLPGATALVDRHRIWKVRESVDHVFAFEHAHRPAGSRITETGASDYGPNRSESLTFSFPSLKQIATRQLVVNIVPLEDGWTGIRVDAQDVWVVARPGFDRVPAGVREIDVGARRVIDASKVRTIIRWFDALPLNQPGVFHCPAIRGGSVVTIDFRGAGGKLLASARGAYNHGVSGPCNPIEFKLPGRPAIALAGGRFFARVERLAG